MRNFSWNLKYYPLLDLQLTVYIQKHCVTTRKSITKILKINHGTKRNDCEVITWSSSMFASMRRNSKIWGAYVTFYKIYDPKLNAYVLNKFLKLRLRSMKYSNLSKQSQYFVSHVAFLSQLLLNVINHFPLWQFLSKHKKWSKRRLMK